MHSIGNPKIQILRSQSGFPKGKHPNIIVDKSTDLGKKYLQLNGQEQFLWHFITSSFAGMANPPVYTLPPLLVQQSFFVAQVQTMKKRDTSSALQTRGLITIMCLALHLIHWVKSRRNTELQNAVCFFFFCNYPQSPLLFLWNKEILSINFGLYTTRSQLKCMRESCSLSGESHHNYMCNITGYTVNSKHSQN